MIGAYFDGHLSQTHKNRFKLALTIYPERSRINVDNIFKYY